MHTLIMALLAALRSCLRTHAGLVFENLALRHQIVVLQRAVPHPRLHPAERLLWTWLSTLWPAWKEALVIVRPETVLGWHRLGLRVYWRWKSRRQRPGRPAVAQQVHDLIRNDVPGQPPLGRAPRIHGELRKLGIDVAQSTVAGYGVRPRKPPSQTWRAFLDNHVTDLVAMGPGVECVTRAIPLTTRLRRTGR